MRPNALSGELPGADIPQFRRGQRPGLPITVGIRDITLAGEMKDLMNSVAEAKKAAETDLIFSREETAAVRTQSTAKLLTDNRP